MNSSNLKAFAFLRQLGVSKFNIRLAYYKLDTTHRKSWKARIQTTDSNLRSSSALAGISTLNLDVVVVAPNAASRVQWGRNRRRGFRAKFMKLPAKSTQYTLLFPKFVPPQQNELLLLQRRKFLRYAVLHHNPCDPHTPPHSREFVSLYKHARPPQVFALHTLSSLSPVLLPTWR